MSRGPISGSCEEGNCHLCNSVVCDHGCHTSPGARAARLGKLAFEEYSRATALPKEDSPNWFYLPQLERNGWIAAATAIVNARDKGPL